MRSHIINAQHITQEIDRIKWENNGKAPNIIAIVPHKIKRETDLEYEVIEVKIIYE